MRTLKKTLALVLCLAMMVGLCAFGASAKDFTDADEIEYAEEVDLLVGIGVIDGIPAGDEFKFDPTGILTREQACKIITTMLGYGEIAPKAAPFTDVPADKWSAGYIATCAGLGIVAGVGDGTFNPTGKLTAEAWQKMLLCALGYDAEAEGLVGASWEVGVAKLVKKTDLSDGITLSPIAEVTREEACKLAYNALTVPEVEYNGGTHVSTGDGTQVDISDPAEATGTFIAQNFGLAVDPIANNKDFKRNDFTSSNLDAFGTDSVFSGVIIENSANTTTPTKTKVYTDNGNEKTFTVKTGADLLGHYVTIYQSTKASAGVYPVYAVEDYSKLVHIGRTAVTTQAGFATAFGRTDIVGAGAVQFNVFGGGAVYATGATTADYTVPNANANTTYVLFGRTVKAEIPDAMAQVKLTKVTKIETAEGKEAITFSGYAALSNGKLDSVTKKPVDVVNEYDGIAVGDIVIVSQVGAIYNVTKAETVTGTISKIGSTAKDEDAITIDGTVYMPSRASIGGQVAAAQNAAIVVGTVVDVPANTITAADMKGNTYTLYLDGNGDYVACVLVEGTSVASAAKYVVNVFQKMEGTTYGDKYKYYAQTVGLDGTVENILIGVFDTAQAIPNPLANSAYTIAEGTFGLARGFYTFASDNTAGSMSGALGFKKATAVAAPFAEDTFTGNETFNATKKSVALTTAGTAYVNANTKYIFLENSGIPAAMKATVQSNPISMTLNAANAAVLVSADADGNKIVTAVVYDGAYANTAVDPANVLFLASNAAGTQIDANGTTAKGYTYTAYKCDTGEKITITCAAASIADTDNGFFTYTEKDGVYTLTALAEGSDADATAAARLVWASQTYKGKLGTNILAGNVYNGDYLINADVTDVTIVDIRTGGELTSLDAIATEQAANEAANNGKSIYLNMILGVGKAAAKIIFVSKVA